MKKEALEVFEKALSDLPESYQTMIHLKDTEGFSYIQIANILGLTVQAVKSRIHRVKRQDF